MPTSADRDQPAAGRSDGTNEVEDLRRRLDATEETLEHWRQLAHEKEAAHAELATKPSVEVLLWLQRRLAPLRRRSRALGSAQQRLSSRARLALLAARSRHWRAPAPSTSTVLRETEATSSSQVTVVVFEETPNRSGHSKLPTGGGAGIRCAGSQECLAAALATAETPYVTLVRAEAAVPDARALDRLVKVLQESAAAAVAPVILHPQRPWHSATPYDSRTRLEGLSFTVGADAVPRVKARRAGKQINRQRSVQPVDALDATCVVLDRLAVQQAGGWPPIDDPDLAMVDLSCSLRARGNEIRVLPAEVVTDGRPVRSPGELVNPLVERGRPWTTLIERSGPAMVRRARNVPSDVRRLAITVSCPNAARAPFWGDWHLAGALARGLRSLDHEVTVQTHDQADHPRGRSCDVHLVICGRERVRATPGQRQVLWIISHPELIDLASCEAADLVLVASDRFADHLRSIIDTPVEVLHQATDHHRFGPEAGLAARSGVVVVAKTRGVRRPMVDHALAAGLRPQIYGGGWTSLVDSSLVVAEHVPNEDLPRIYAEAEVVLNDHWDDMRKWGFVSNRLFDVLACETPVVTDPIDGLEPLFGTSVKTARNPHELQAAIEAIRHDPTTASQSARDGRAAVLAHHTFEHRAHQLVELLDEHGL